MLQKIEIQNFKKHLGPLTVSLTPGVNVIVGKNWAGKSTLLWAIVYALFGPSYVPGGSKLVSPRSGGKPSVRLSMRLQGHDYEAYRTPDKAELRRDGKLVANGASVMTKAVEDLLGMPAATFTLLRMAQQNEASAILTLGTAKLGQIVDQITKVDVVDKVITASSSTASRLQASLDVLPVVPLMPLVAAATSLREKLDWVGSESRTASFLASQAEASASKAQEALQSLNRQRLEYLQQEKKASSVREALSAISAQVANLLPDASKASIELDPLEADVVAWNEFSLTRSQCAQQEANLTELTKELDAASLWLEDNGDWGEIQEEDLKTVEAKLKETEKQVWSLGDKLERVLKAASGAVCPTCQRPFEGHDPELLRVEAEELKKSLAQKKQESSAHALAAGSLYEARELSLHKAVKREILQKQVEASRNAVLDLRTRLEASSGFSAPSVEAAQSALFYAKESNKKRLKALDELKKLERLKAEWEALLAQFVAIYCPSEQEISSAETSHSLAAASALQFRTAAAAVTQQLQACQRELEDAEAALERERKVAAQRQELERTLDLNKRLTAYLRKNRDVFTSKVWEQLLKTCSDFVFAATSGQIGQVARSQEGQFQYLEEDGGSSSWMPVNAASGVQQAILGVGVRLALAEALGGVIDFILLDEVTAGAHDDLSLEIVGALSDLDQQVLVVTHRQGDAAVADNLIQL